MRILFYFGLLLIPAFMLKALPQFSLISGNRCASCHVNYQGGGQRNDLGWYSYRDAGLINPEDLGLGGLWAVQDSLRAFAGQKANLGFDMRMQYVRSRNPEKEARFIPMQFSLYGNYQFTSWLQAEAAYNPGPQRYQGQQAWSGSVIIQPEHSLPSVRLGFIQPTVGIRYDDHTMLIRQIAAGWLNEYIITPYNSMTVLAPNFAAWGGEVNYEGLHWLSASAGVYSNSTLNENSITAAEQKGLSYSGRITFWPRFFENSLNTYLGASVLHNDKFRMMNVYAGIGLTDKVSLMLDMAQTDIQDNSSKVMRDGISRVSGKNTSYLAELTYQLEPWLLPYARLEYAELSAGTRPDIIIRQMVFGAQFFVLPNFEIRPEYRIFDTELKDYISRWGAQLHIYY
jgi:hypothetical protein